MPRAIPTTRALVFSLFTTLAVMATGHAAPPAKPLTQEEFVQLQKKADAGDAEAQFSTGRALMRGEGTQKDPAKAMEYFTKAEQSGHVEASTALGAVYWQGLGAPKDVERARDHFRKALEKGSLLGQYNLAMTYLQQGEPESSRAEALEHLHKAAGAGLVAAQLELGDAYFRSKHGLAKDAKKAYDYYLKAGMQNDVYAQNMVGLFLRDGLAGTVDAPLAVKWFRRASDAGELKARANLGSAYLYGNGVEKDKIEALALFMTCGNEPIAQRLKDVAAEGLTPEQIEAANTRAKAISPMVGRFYATDSIKGTPTFDKGGPMPGMPRKQ